MKVQFWPRVLLITLLLALPAITWAQTGTLITVDPSAPSHAFPHFWEQMFGSGRAVLSLRDSYRQDLRQVKQITGFEYVRFHAIFHDEVGLYDEDPQGKPVYNFSYVDQIYDGLLANGVRPFVELSFMPKKLASKEILPPCLHKEYNTPRSSRFCFLSSEQATQTYWKGP